ncbi:MAG: hypothetical protein B6245_03735 [Desulfobacteraceae bacterium 4572_88]|nr:MAG: hypothetical protein B6245_03735 [Desulfobacteraceae bacterium 4572_88]
MTPFHKMNRKIQQIPTPWRIGIAAVAWLIIISVLHYGLNGEHGDETVIRMGYMPVITNLAAPLLDEASKDLADIRFSAIKFASFAEMAEALRNDDIQVAFMIAPLSVVLRQQGEDVKIVCIGNRHESTLVARKDLNVKTLADLKGKTLAVPMRYSGHNLSVLEMMAQRGLSNQIRIVEMNPPDMASALAVGSLDAYYVGEPFAAQTVKSGHADVLYYVEDVWKYFICNLVLVRQAFIETSPDVVQMFVQGAARSGIWAGEHTREVAEIASRHWNQPPELVEYALSTPPGRILYERFVPMEAEIQHMADLMVRFGLIQGNQVEGLVEDRFAKAANIRGVTGFDSILGTP